MRRTPDPIGKARRAGRSLEVENGTLQLRGDKDAPGPSQIFGTNSLGERGWLPYPTAATNLSYDASTRLLASSTGADVTLPLMSSGNAGLVPSSGGGTTNFLRADGTWAAPGGGPSVSYYSVQAAVLYGS